MSYDRGSTDVFVPVFIDESNILEGAAKVISAIRPAWDPSAIHFKLFTDGITNKLVACSQNNDTNNKDIVLVRIYGNKTDLFIDRKTELRNLKLLHSVGLAPNLYAVFENGLAYEYVPGVTLSTESVVSSKIWPLVAKRMALMHKVSQDPNIPAEVVLWSKIEQFLNLLPGTFCDAEKQERFAKHLGSVPKLKMEYEFLKSFLINVDSPIVFAHNDLLLGNVVYNEDENEVTFIDYEYAGYNYQAYDIANHFAEFAGMSDIDYNNYPSKEFQIKWLREYSKIYLDREEILDEELETFYLQVNKFVLAAHFLWGIWALIQAEYSHIDFNFIEFAIVRLNEYYAHKNKVFQELS